MIKDVSLSETSHVAKSHSDPFVSHVARFLVKQEKIGLKHWEWPFREVNRQRPNYLSPSKLRQREEIKFLPPVELGKGVCVSHFPGTQLTIADWSLWRNPNHWKLQNFKHRLAMKQLDLSHGCVFFGWHYQAKHSPLLGVKKCNKPVELLLQT